jgi:septal ring factor EnvC (AmiA/AmiB activator)
MLENVENARKSSKRKIIYYILASFLVAILFVVLFAYLGNRIDRSLETSSKLMIKEMTKVSDNIDEVKSDVEDGETRMNSLDEILVSNTSDVQLLRDSLYLLNREIKSLNSKINSLVQWQKEQKQLNEYWGGKTLELLNWKIDIDQASKLEELKRMEQQNKIVIPDSTPVIKEVDSTKVEIKKNRKRDNSIKVKDGRNY